MTSIYTHVLPAMQKEAMKKMGDCFEKDDEKPNSTENRPPCEPTRPDEDREQVPPVR